MDAYDRFTAALMDGLAIIAEAAAEDMKIAGFPAANLDVRAALYRRAAEGMRHEPTEFVYVTDI